MTFLSFKTRERATVVRAVAELHGVDFGHAYFLPRCGDCLWFVLVEDKLPDTTFTIYCQPDYCFYEWMGSYGFIDDLGAMLKILAPFYRKMDEDEEDAYRASFTSQ